MKVTIIRKPYKQRLLSQQLAIIRKMPYQKRSIALAELRSHFIKNWGKNKIPIFDSYSTLTHRGRYR